MITLIIFIALLCAYVVIMVLRGIYRERREYRNSKVDEIYEE